MDPVFVNLIDTVTYGELLNYLRRFGKVANYDDERLVSSPGCIVFGDVLKVYPPVPLANGYFNAVFLMKQVNHTSTPHEEFRIVLRLRSPGPLADLDVGSFLAVFNPQPYIAAKMRSFSSGPDAVVVWYSKSSVPLSKLEDVGKSLRAPAVAQSPKSLEIRSLQHSILQHQSKPAASTSANRSGGEEERIIMPPPSSCIYMKRHHRTVNPPLEDSGSYSIARHCCSVMRHLKRSDSHNRAHSHHPNCLHHSRILGHHCLSEQASCNTLDCQDGVPCQVQTRCCNHPVIASNPDVSLLSRCCCHRSCPPVEGGSCHHSRISKHFKCCLQSVCECSCRKYVGHQPSKSCEKTLAESPEGNQWFIKAWVDHSNSKIGQENSCFRGRDQIQSQQSTSFATYGGSMIENAISDDDNFTSISQVFPIADSAQRFITHQQSQLPLSSRDSDSDSSLSDTSALFQNSESVCPPTKPMLVVENPLTNPEIPLDIGSSVIFKDKESSVPVEKGFVTDKLPSSGVQTENVSSKASNQIELDASVSSFTNTELTNDLDSQKTCSQLFPSPQYGYRTSDSDSEESSHKIRKKKKLFNPSNSSWIFNSENREPHVTCNTDGESDNNGEIIHQIECRSMEVVNVQMETEQNERNSIDVKLISQESDDVIPPTDEDTNNKNTRHGGLVNLIADEGRNESVDKPSCHGKTVKKHVEDIIMEWSSDNYCSSSAVPSETPANDTLEVITDEQNPNTKISNQANSLIESGIPGSGNTALQLQTSQSIPTDSFLMDGEKSLTSNDQLEQTTKVTNTEIISNSGTSMILGESNQDANSGTKAASSKLDNLSSLSELGSSSHIDILNTAERISDHGNKISETESSSVECRQLSIEIPITPQGEESSPNLVKEDSKHPSPDSTTDGLSDELKEYSRRNSPASTVFYDAENDNKVSEIPLGDSNILERVSLPNQIFGVEGIIVDAAPHIEEGNMTKIVKGVCRLGCKSTFDHDLVIQLPSTISACTACDSRSHYSCPQCQESGLQKLLCLEFAFELHVLIGDKILRLQVEQKEGVKFLGIRAKEYARKSTRALEILRKLQALYHCIDMEEKNLKMIGQVYIKTEQRLGKIVPLLVSTSLKDFKMRRMS